MPTVGSHNGKRGRWWTEAEKPAGAVLRRLEDWTLFKGLPNLAALMRQAQQMGSKYQEVQEKLKSQRAAGSAGGGMIRVEVNGLGELLKVSIEPQLVERGDREMIEDLIPAAVNQALAKARQLHVEAMKSVAAELDVPGLGEAISRLAQPD